MEWSSGSEEEEVEQKPVRVPYTKNHIVAKIHKIRQELKEASEEQRPPLEKLRSILRKKLVTLHRAERRRK